VLAAEYGEVFCSVKFTSRLQRSPQLPLSQFFTHLLRLSAQHRLQVAHGPTESTEES